MLLTAFSLLMSLAAAQVVKDCAPCFYMTYYNVQPDKVEDAMKILKDYQNQANSTLRNSSYLLPRMYQSYEHQIMLVETWHLKRNSSDEAYKNMVSLMNNIVIAPVIDKEHIILDGMWGYNQDFTDGIFTITHWDSMPDLGKPDYSDRVAALQEYASNSKGYKDLKVFVGA